jgi:hypothetical protein
MSLIDSMKEDCVMVDKRSVPDGIGGFMYQWEDGARFQAAIVKDRTMEARIAEKQGVTEIYTVTVSKTLPLEYHDVFRRLSDGAIFRVTSNVTDSKTPKVASFQFGQVTAERWVLS